jgi:hypothetical protein
LSAHLFQKKRPEGRFFFGRESRIAPGIASVKCLSPAMPADCSRCHRDNPDGAAGAFLRRILVFEQACVFKLCVS